MADDNNGFDLGYSAGSLFDMPWKVEGDYNPTGLYGSSGAASRGGADASSSSTLSTTAKSANVAADVFNALNTAVGSYYAAKTQQYQLKSQASSEQFQAGMDAIQAHAAEMSAQSIEEQGKTQVQQYTMRAGQEQAADTVATAARGVDLSSASAIDQRASNDLMKQLGVLTINSNTTRQAWAQRTQATQLRNAALMSQTSAQNDLGFSNAIHPDLAATNSLLNSAQKIDAKWQRYGVGSAGI